MPAWSALSDAPICPHCHAQEGIVVGSGTRVHFARLLCGQCGLFLRWLPRPKETPMEKKTDADPFVVEPEPVVNLILDTTPDPTDDIEDPVVPESVAMALAAETVAPLEQQFHAHEALLHGFCQVLQQRMGQYLADEHKRFMVALDGTWQLMHAALEKLTAGNEHATYQLSNALTALQASGVQVTGSPYTASVVATSPEGYRVSFTLEKQTAGELVEELGRIGVWLRGQGYGGVGVQETYHVA